MSIASEIQRIKNNIASAYTEAENKGATLPTERNSANLSSVVMSIPTGGGTTIEKGIIVKAIDNDGYVTDAEIVGMTTIPMNYLYTQASYKHYLSKIVNLKLPDNITSIGNSAFNYDENLSSINLSNTITSIGGYAFNYNRKLGLTELPSGLKTIGEYAFYYCQNLALREIPSGVTLIDSRTFYGCSNIRELTLLGKITLIGTYAYYSCSNLTKLVLPNITAVPTLSNKNAFTSTPIASGTGYIYVPDNLVSSFQSASNWSTYASQIKGLSELEG